MTPVEEAEKYNGYIVLPGHNSIFEIRTGRTGYRWDGSMLDCIYKDAGINTVSFTDPSNALTVLTQQGKIRKRNRYRIGDAVFLAENNYVGILTGIDDKHHVFVRVGWRPDKQGKRAVRVMRLHTRIDVLAFADPVLPVRERIARRAVDVTQRNQIADLLSLHPAVDGFVSPDDLRYAYARWQRYCGYGPDKATGFPDEKSLERLCREERGRP